MTAIGLIGVGYIGKRLVDRLLDAGYRVTVFDVEDDQTAYAIDRGARAASSPAEVARESDVVILTLPGSPEVEATMEGADGLLAELDPGDLLVDVSTTRPSTSVACEELCAEAGVDFLEAPITGGSPREGYHVMAGGFEGSYERAAEVLDVIADDHVRVGPVPEATVFKLGLQMRYAGHHAVDAEVVEFVRDNGVDPTLFTDFLEFEMYEGYFTGEFGRAMEGLGTLAIWNKDLGYATDFAGERGTALPLTAAVREAYKATTRRVDDGDGHAAALITYWMLLNDGEGRFVPVSE
ncbi:NAD(P)-dependent oxidoreductase [Halorubrum cibi]|uniref:2-hydroxy-3-oxopropionate reductase n=1 Tax=Halorubrum cibi TaxID=413815 RepID=A0A521EWI3_9EURY|nr:NAD(P)-dependent oxidoreductase [Halorubrum cibi]SMO88275.1 2-hydroxy-3-oxopropionate reductase [Halorubrum cibi]